GFLISTAGSFFGVLFGILYAQLMIYGLTTWWVDAVTVPFLQLHINPMSLVIGFISGVVLSVLTILWSVRGVTKVPLRTLLHGVVERQQKETADGRRQTAADTKESQRAGDNEQCNPHMGCRKIFNRIMLFFFLFVFLLVLEPHPIKFFLVGALLLLLGTRAVSKRFTVSSRTDNTIDSLVKFASSNAVRNRSRSLLCIALIASTTFLVLSISAFYLDSGMRGRHGESNHGGYYYIGETMFPVFIDIGTPEGRAQLGIQPGDEAYLEEKRHVYDSTREAECYIKERIVSLRVQGGDSVSCLNLYQSGTPRVLGIPKSTFEEITYQFFSSERRSQADNKYKPEKSVWSPIWQPITIDPDGVRRVLVIIDKNTAMYSLHLYGGVGDVYELDIGQGEKVRCEIVGLLYNSVLQGEIMMGEENFLTLFPEVGGYQYFLFRRGMYADSKIDNRTLKIYYDLLGDYGFQGEPTADRLRKLFAVQNTYLSTFQSLGGIGLLLGIFGLAVIQVRNVFERRKELALLQAIGFTKSRTILLLLYESFTLLAWGLGLAVLASAFALLPFLLGGVEQISPLSVLRQFIVLVGSLLAVGVVSNIAAAMSVLKIHAAAELAEER
ncbi:MAG: ABC transporter permease, partial [Planctomycetaceae bacterium]|nr:ABC transporter permease [Planctomycetaceae bacterium]